MSRKSPEALRRRAASLAPWLIVTIVGLVLLWPVPLGRMPLSADHTVHLTRIWTFADVLTGGHVRGWSDVWGLGTPVGELYPVLGDLVVIAVRVVSLGILDWHQAYAIGFSICFLVPAWAMLAVGRVLGLGPLPGTVAAVLTLADPGAYREGGWIYTVDYGVWPQHLATGLTWLGLSELCIACMSDDGAITRRRIGTSGLALGGALLAHPMAVPAIATGGVLLVLVLGVRDRARLPRVAAIAACGGAIALAVAAWWLVPMLTHRGWMASYGWTWQPLARMAEEALHGRWAQHMASAVGAAIGVGIVLLAVRGNAPGRFIAAYALVMWLLASQDALWELRLDRLSAGFLHVQYQRFVVAAKPGLFVAAGATLGLFVRAIAYVWRTGWPRPSAARPVAGALSAIAVAATLWIAKDQYDAMIEHRVGSVQITRAPEPSTLDEDYPALVQWLAQQWAQRGDAFYRMTVVAPRNVHWFMDAPVLTGMPLYKQGFTPGDNFVHKPESGKDALLDRARVRYVVVPHGRGGRGTEVARFGELRVLERAGWDTQPVAWIEGAGAIEVLEDEPHGGPVRVRVSGTDATTQLVFAVSGYPRWIATQGGSTLPWREVPVVGDGPSADPDARRRGDLRGGKALGDDGSEPTLFAVTPADGEVELVYDARTSRDVIAGLLSALAIALCTALAGPLRRWPGLSERSAAVVRQLAVLLRPWVLGAVVIVAMIAAGLRWRAAAADESSRAVGRVLEGHAQVRGARPGLIKSDMLIRPAVLVNRKRSRPAELELHGVTLGPTLHGWFAIDDDAAQMPRKGTHNLRILAVSDAGEVVLMPARLVAHRPGQHAIAIETGALAGTTVTLHVIVESEGDAPPPFGFDLELDPTEVP